MTAYKDTSLFFYNICTNHWKLDKILLTIRESNADLVIIDDLQMIEVERDETIGNRYVKDKMDCILKEIKALSVQAMIPIIGTYCISAKNINKRQDHRPMLMDLEFDSLQQYPDNIQLLYRDVLYNPDNIEFKHVVEMITAKNILNQCYIAQAAYLNGAYVNIESDKI